MAMILNEETAELTLDEFDLHDILAGLYHLYQTGSGNEMVERIKLVSTDERFTPELVAKWERKVNGLLALMHEFDAEYHEDAEFTC